MALGLAQQLLEEFEEQAPVTRRFLERLPQEQYLWQPHPKSMTAGQLAYHLALVPGSILRFMQCNPAAPPNFGFPQPTRRNEVLALLDDSAATVRSLLPKLDDAAMAETWRIAADGRELLAAPRGYFLRNSMLNHWYQHRGQFSVYLRLLNIPVPSSWGPSADEPAPFQRR